MCGKEFNAVYNRKTCCEKCSKIQEKRSNHNYNREYYKKNWVKWREYEKSRKKDKLGTGDLLEKMRRHPNGDPDFDSEELLIKREKIKLALLYPK